MAAVRIDWHLAEWLKASAKKQADLVRDLGWNRAKASLLCNGKQSYTREDVAEVSVYLNLKPYELLMNPDDAMAIRRFRGAAAQVVAIGTAEVEPELLVRKEGRG